MFTAATCGIFSIGEGGDLDMLKQDIRNLQTRVEKLENLANDNTSGASLSDWAMEGKIKFNTFCTACHKDEFSNPMLAPPMAMVKNHYGKVYGNNKEAFVDAIVNWVKAPNPDKTLMPGAIRNFNIMPAFPLPDNDLKAIATYLFEADIALPRGFEQHMPQKDTPMGRGRGGGSGPGRQSQKSSPGSGQNQK